MISLQKSDLEELIYNLEDIVKQKDYVGLGVDEDTINRLLDELRKDEKNLKYSNDSRIDMIVKKVMDVCSDERIKEILEKADIKSLFENKTPSTRMKSADNFIIETGRPFLHLIQQVSDIAGCLYMSNALPEVICKNGNGMILLEYALILIYCIERKTNESYEPPYWSIQGLMKAFDEQVDVRFTDFLIYFGGEICDATVAFLIGHEFGHQSLGHFYELESIENCVDAEEKKKKRWKLELNADIFGVEFALMYIKTARRDADCFRFLEEKEDIRENMEYRILGIPLAFLGSKLYDERMIGESASHPSLNTRLENVWNYLQINGASFCNVEELKDKYKDLCITIDNLQKFSHLFEKINGDS